MKASGQKPSVAFEAWKSRAAPAKTLGQAAEMDREGVEDRERVRADEDEEDRREDRHGLLDAPEVQDDQDEQDRDLGADLVAGHRRGEKIPDLVAGRRDGHADREDVVDEERAARDDADLPAQELRRDEVAAAAARKVLDEVRVRDRDDRDRDRRHRDEDDGERAMAPESPEGLVRTVGGGREPVGPEADPREERDERDPVKDVRVLHVPRLAQEDLGDLAGFRHPRRRRAESRDRAHLPL